MDSNSIKSDFKFKIHFSTINQLAHSFSISFFPHLGHTRYCVKRKHFLFFIVFVNSHAKALKRSIQWTSFIELQEHSRIKLWQWTFRLPLLSFANWKKNIKTFPPLVLSIFAHKSWNSTIFYHSIDNRFRFIRMHSK